MGQAISTTSQNTNYINRGNSLTNFINDWSLLNAYNDNSCQYLNLAQEGIITQTKYVSVQFPYVDASNNILTQTSYICSKSDCNIPPPQPNLTPSMNGSYISLIGGLSKCPTTPPTTTKPPTTKPSTATTTPPAATAPTNPAATAPTNPAATLGIANGSTQSSDVSTSNNTMYIIIGIVVCIFCILMVIMAFVLFSSNSGKSSST